MNKIIINYIFNASFQLLLILVPFITQPYIARVLGPESLGVYAYTYSIIQLLMIIGMVGIPLYGNRQIAMALVEGKEKVSSEFWSIYIIQLIMMVISITFYLFYSLSLPDNTQIISLLQGINLIASMLDISWLLLGLQKVKQVIYRNLIIKILSIVLIFMLVKEVNDLDIYILIVSGSTLAGQIFLWTYSRKYLNFGISLNRLSISKHIKPIISLFLPQILGQLYLSFDKIILNYFSNATQVGFYDQAMKIIKLITTLVTSLGTVVLPSITTEFVKGNTEKIRHYVKMILIYILFISIPMVLGLISISSNFIEWYLGDDFSEVANILIIISPTILFIGLGSLFGIQILAAINQNNKLTFSIFCGALVSILISLIFVPGFGMYATAIATLLTEMTVAAIQLYFVKDYLKLKEIKRSLAFYLISGILMSVIILLISLLRIPVLLETVIQVFAGIISYLLILFLLKEDFIIQLKDKILVIIKSRLKK